MWYKSLLATQKHLSVNPKNTPYLQRMSHNSSNTDTSKGFKIILSPEHDKLCDHVATILISTSSLTVYGKHAMRSQKNQSTRTLIYILKSLTFNLKSRSTTINHGSTSGRSPGTLIGHSRTFHIWKPQAPQQGNCWATRKWQVWSH